ncbi:MAG TPA: M23 family metallopeptidase [Solirubrobacterales bacterium]|nr:M23 family metallopeptidase [Solirubrobacterales bacterium]
MIFRSLTATFSVAVLLFGLGAANTAAAPDPGTPDPAGPLGFKLVRGTVVPKEAVPESVDPQRIVFRFRASRPVELSIRIVKLGEGRTVRRFRTGPRRPGRWQRQAWDGLDGKGRLVGAGKYRVLVGPAGGPLRRLSRLRLHRYRFPIAGPHGTRGAVGEFGADRVDNRTHEGFDATGACGTPLVAMRAGIVLKSAYDPELKGNYVVYKGRSERRVYLYAHMERPAPVRVGQKIRAGRRLGTIGQTGNAAGTPCHLHIEMRSRGRLLNPEPVLNGALNP